MRFLKDPNFCTRFFYGTVEILAFCSVMLLISWFAQSKQVVIHQIDPPKVLAVTEKYIDVEWHNQRLLDCPTVGTPMFFTPLATEQTPSRPVAASLEEQKFIRRYIFPEGLMKAHKDHADHGIDYKGELKILIEAKCNPLWTTQEVIRVPFWMPKI
jgi:hypothetical protein